MLSTDPANVAPGTLAEAATTLYIEPAKPPEERIFSTDYYEILRLGPQADGETIERVYRTLSGRFHSKDPGTSDAAVLQRIRKAYETLSNPAKRAQYNALRQCARGSARFRLRDREFFDGVRGEQNRRLAVLCLLYRQRIGESPGLTVLDLEQMTGCTREELGPALWYLCEKKWAKYVDGAAYNITAAGFDIVEGKLEAQDAAKLWAWLYPEDTDGNEFANRKERPKQLAAQSQRTIALMPQSPASNAAATRKRNSQTVTETERTDINAGDSPAPAERTVAALVREEPAVEPAIELVEDPVPAERTAQGLAAIAAATGSAKEVTRFADRADSRITEADVDTVARQREERDATTSRAWNRNEFGSAEEVPAQVATQRQQTIAVMPESLVTATAEVPEKQNSRTATETEQTDITAGEPSGAEAEVAEVLPVAAMAEQVAQEPLPIAEAFDIAQAVAEYGDDAEYGVTAAGLNIFEGNPVAAALTLEPLGPDERAVTALVRDVPATGLAMELAEDPAPAEQVAQEPFPIAEAFDVAQAVAEYGEDAEDRITAAGLDIFEDNPVEAALTPEPLGPDERAVTALVRQEPAAGLAMGLDKDPAPAGRIAQEPIPIAEAFDVAQAVAEFGEDAEDRITAAGLDIFEDNPVAAALTSEPPAPAERALTALVRDEPAAGLAMGLDKNPAPAGRIAQGLNAIAAALGFALGFTKQVTGFGDVADYDITGAGFDTVARQRDEREATKAWAGLDPEDTDGNEFVSTKARSLVANSAVALEKQSSQPVTEAEQTDIKTEEVSASAEVAVLVLEEPAAELAMELAEDAAPVEQVAQEPTPIAEAPGIGQAVAESVDDAEYGVSAAAGLDIVESDPVAAMVAALVPDEPAAGLAMELLEDAAPAEQVGQAPTPIAEALSVAQTVAESVDDAEYGISSAAGLDTFESNPVAAMLTALVLDEPTAGLAMELVEDQAPAEQVAQDPLPIAEAPGIAQAAAESAGLDIFESDPVATTVAALVPDEPAAGLAMELAEDQAPAEQVEQAPIPVTEALSVAQAVAEPAGLDTFESDPVAATLAALVLDEPAAGLAMELAEDQAPAEQVAQAAIPVAEALSVALAVAESLGLDIFESDPVATTVAALVPDEPAAGLAMEFVEDPAPAEQIEQDPAPVAEALSVAQAVAESLGLDIFESDPVAATVAALVPDEPAAGLAMELLEDPAPAEQVAQAPTPIAKELSVAQTVAESAGLDIFESDPVAATLTALVPDETAAGLAMELADDQAPAEQVEQDPTPIAEALSVAQAVAESAVLDSFEGHPVAATVTALVDEPAAGLAMELLEDPDPAEQMAPGTAHAIAESVDDAGYGDAASGSDIVETDPVAATLTALVPDEPAAGLAAARSEEGAESSIAAAAGFEIVERAGLRLRTPPPPPRSRVRARSPKPSRWASKPRSRRRLPRTLVALVRDEPAVGLAIARSEEGSESSIAAAGFAAGGLELFESHPVAALVRDEPAAGLAMELVEGPAPAEQVAQERTPIAEALSVAQAVAESGDDAEYGIASGGLELFETDPVAALVPDEPAAGLAMELVEDPVPAEQAALEPTPIAEAPGITQAVAESADDAGYSITAAAFGIAERAGLEPEDRDGNEFAYTKARPTQLAAESHQIVPGMPEFAVATPDAEAEAAEIFPAAAPAERTLIPVGEAPGTTMQVAGSLETVHEESIVQGDPKPANIRIEPDDPVRKPDKKPAKPAKQAKAAFESPAMAPEKARENGAGMRARFRAFGVALRGTLAEVPQTRPQEKLKSPPAADWRFQNPYRSEQRARASRRSRWEKALEVAAVVFAVSTAAVAFVYFYQHSLADRSLRYQISTPETAAAEYPTLAPDGSSLAFVARNGGPSQLWVLNMDTRESRALPGTAGASYPFWSPDGAYLGFFTHGKLRKIALAGGPPQTLCDASGGRGGTWNRNDVILFSPGPARPIFSVPAAGGVPTRVTKLAADGGPGAGHRFPVFLPDGLHFLYTAGSNKQDSAGVFVGSLDGAAAVRLLPEDTNVLYAPPPKPGDTAQLLFRRENALMAQPFDASGLKIAGEMFPLAEQVQDGGSPGFGAFSVSENGILVFRSAGASANGELVRVDRTDTGTGASPASPDNKMVAAEPITVVTNWYRSHSPSSR